MGSQLRLAAWTADEPSAVAAFEQVFREFDRLEALLSIWKPGSDVVRINEAAGRTAVAVSRDTIVVLEAAAQASEWTGGQTFATLELSNGTLSTSGDYERFFIENGIRYHHLLDPDRGTPAAGSRSVTIVADSAMLADVLSTGVFVLGPEAGMALLERLPQVEGVIVSASNQVLVSSGLTGRVTLIAPPTDAP